MVNYQNGKIYKIESFIGNVVYYGSTCQLLCQRMAKHRTFTNEPNSTITSKQVLEYPDAKIYLVELYPCNSKAELHSREGYYIKNNDCVNKNIAGRTKKEYCIDNKISISQKHKVYYSDNKESLLQKRKVYRENNKESISQKKKVYRENNKELISQKDKVYRENNKESIIQKKKEYYSDNKESISQKNKVYRENNKEKIKAYYNDNKEKIKLHQTKPYTCDCGNTIRYDNKTRHFKTQHHLKYINSII